MSPGLRVKRRPPTQKPGVPPSTSKRDSWMRWICSAPTMPPASMRVSNWTVSPWVSAACLRNRMRSRLTGLAIQGPSTVARTGASSGSCARNPLPALPARGRETSNARRRRGPARPFPALPTGVEGEKSAGSPTDQDSGYGPVGAQDQAAERDQRALDLFEVDRADPPAGQRPVAEAAQATDGASFPAQRGEASQHISIAAQLAAQPALPRRQQ